jgi:hypothetical protein
MQGRSASDLESQPLTKEIPAQTYRFYRDNSIKKTIGSATTTTTNINLIAILGACFFINGVNEKDIVAEGIGLGLFMAAMIINFCHYKYSQQNDENDKETLPSFTVTVRR